MVSVLVPVYNVEKYIDRCIDSILKQTYSNIEILIVWQPSEDNSKKILDKWEKKDKRIQVIEQENADLARARNTLVKWAHGDYIIFVDSDDLIEKDYIENLMYVMEREKADIIVSECMAFKDSNRIEKKEFAHKWDVYSNEEFQYRSMLGKFGSISGVSQLKLYNKKVFENVEFPEERFCEDTATIYKTIWNAKKIIMVPYAGYYYQSSRDDSIMHSKKMKEKVLIDGLRARVEQADFFQNISPKLYAVASFNIITEIMRLKGHNMKTINTNEYVQSIYKRKIKYFENVISGEIPISKKIIACGCVSMPHIMYGIWKSRRQYLYKKEWRNKG